MQAQENYFSFIFVVVTVIFVHINGLCAKTGSSPFSVSLNLAFIDEETLVVFHNGIVYFLMQLWESPGSKSQNEGVLGNETV